MCGDSLQRRLVMELKNLDSLLPEIPMSPKEIVNYFVDNYSDNTFAEAEKFFRKMGDNSSICSCSIAEKY